MTDPLDAWLPQQLASLNKTGSHLLCLDENTSASLLDNHYPSLQVITNRWDVAKGLIEFSDFDFSGIANESLDTVIYRVSKEKAIVHHILNQAWRCLKLNGQLLIAGYKQEGIKTYCEKIASLMSDEKKIEKNGPVYSARIIKKKNYLPELLLDDEDYTQVRPIAENSGLTLVSKPGCFGWNKIDAGSALLITELTKHKTEFIKKPFIKKNGHCLDLGCGYGYLTIATAQIDEDKKISQWTLTDNNAAALITAQINTQNKQLQAQIIASDAGMELDIKADLILCNPPFHQGFNTESDLTDKFLLGAKKNLALQGVAIFVVNQFIPLERKAASLFSYMTLIANDGHFKVLALRI
jgi:16S rRNA (guanine1207-N2)-methyltransferase